MRRPEDFNVLVVDDEEDVRDYLGDILEDAGFRVRKAVDGIDALLQVRQQTPDFISLDLVMPRKSGIRFLFELRHNKAWTKIPVLIVTAHAHDELGSRDLQDALAGRALAGPRTYVEKPVEADSYLRAVCEALGVTADPVPLQPDDVTNARAEAERLLQEADASKLAEVMRILRGKE